MLGSVLMDVGKALAENPIYIIYIAIALYLVRRWIKQREWEAPLRSLFSLGRGKWKWVWSMDNADKDVISFVLLFMGAVILWSAVRDKDLIFVYVSLGYIVVAGLVYFFAHYHEVTPQILRRKFARYVAGIAAKKLYRKLLKKYHPDFAKNELDRLNREIVTKKITRAYSDGNEEYLRSLDF